MISETITKAILGLLLTAVLSGGIYLVEQKVESWGYAKAEEKYKKVIADYETKTNKKIEDLISTSKSLVEQNQIYIDTLNKGVSDILKSTKGKPLTIIKNGDCTPTTTFSDSFNSINKRINEEMKK